MGTTTRPPGDSGRTGRQPSRSGAHDVLDRCSCLTQPKSRTPCSPCFIRSRSGIANSYNDNPARSGCRCPYRYCVNMAIVGCRYGESRPSAQPGLPRNNRCVPRRPPFLKRGVAAHPLEAGRLAPGRPSPCLALPGRASPCRAKAEMHPIGGQVCLLLLHDSPPGRGRGRRIR
jgi:hypothetical protein